jgi:hypothetical protein
MFANLHHFQLERVRLAVVAVLGLGDAPVAAVVGA